MLLVHCWESVSKETTPSPPSRVSESQNSKDTIWSGLQKEKH